MSLAPLSCARSGSPSELADGIASRTGAWVVVERFGAVVTHGAGRTSCLPTVAAALLAKSSEPLRTSVTWTGRGRRLRGTLDGAPVTALDLGEGGTMWLVDGEHDVDDVTVALLSAALGGDIRPVTDPVVESLLHPRGPSRGTSAPPAVLLVLVSTGPLPLLARAAAAAAAGTTARVHTEDDCVVVATATEDEARAVHAHVQERCAGTRAGLASVATDAADWVTAGRHARAAADAADRLDLALASATAPAVIAELLIADAGEAAGRLCRELGRTPLTRLEEHDARTSSDLVSTLRTWCATGFDVTAAAAEVHVHVNTLRYRIRRAGEICGLDVANPRHLLALQLLLAA